MSRDNTTMYGLNPLETKGKRQRQIRTFRCVHCGFLESYAW